MQMAIEITAKSTPEEKLIAWRQIQELSPDMAEFIRKVSEVFGKPENVKVEAA